MKYKTFSFISGFLVLAMMVFLAGCGTDDVIVADPVVDPPGPSTPVDQPSYEFWIGDTGLDDGPENLGPQQQPFRCWSFESNLGQPMTDNAMGIGNAVYSETVPGLPDYGTTPVGWSKNCRVATRVDYFYFTAANAIVPFSGAPGDGAPLPVDMGYVTVGGVSTPLIIRVEAGTLNRFMYAIAFLAPFAEDTASPATLDNSLWNGKVVNWYRGGVGVGHFQGDAPFHAGLWGSEKNVLPSLFEAGYGIVMSSGNVTDVHYNLRLQGETAVMVKEHFKVTYGIPDKWYGMGASGGAIHQYILGQNNPGLLDGGVPLYSYPDMVTQAIDIADCDLAMQYMAEDATAKTTGSKWYTWSNHSLILGLNAVDTVGMVNAWNVALTGSGLSLPFAADGSNECLEGWFAAFEAVGNPATAPTLNQAAYRNAFIQGGFTGAEYDAIKWTHWNDLEFFYGVDANGFAPMPFDNVGVQYALESLVNGGITPTEFLEINSCIGAWKDPPDMAMWDVVLGGIDFFDTADSTHDGAACRAGTPSPRRSGDISSMQAAYTSGHVFKGVLDIPLVDLRPYLEPMLDMHNSKQSFSSRQRYLNGQGNHDSQVIWFTENELDILPKIMLALNALDEYLAGGGPGALWTDRCYNAAGALIAEGPTVWDGILNGNAAGACTTAYPIKSSTRMLAGDSISGDMFKCALKPVATALGDTTYGAVTFTAGEETTLNAIFPNGVCDYSQPDQGKP